MVASEAEGRGVGVSRPARMLSRTQGQSSKGHRAMVWEANSVVVLIRWASSSIRCCSDGDEGGRMEGRRAAQKRSREVDRRA